MTQASARAVAIIGAGIAGLTAALSLARRGVACDIFEQAATLDEVGAGLQISPNASRILQNLGLLETLESRWNEPERIALACGRTLRPLASVPVGRQAKERWGAPYGVLHRATLQKALLDAVRADPLCTLHLSSRIEGDGPAALAGQAGGRHDLTIAADGVWSSMRARVPGAGRPRFSGNIAWRFLVPLDRAPAFLDRRDVTAFLGPAAHLVAYPLAESQAFNIVAIHQASSPGDGWSHEPGEDGRARLLNAFGGWHAEIGDLLRLAERPLVWPLHECGDGRWFDGRSLVLIGDAAHAMTPFAAQGAAMAIEDAAHLAAVLSSATDIRSALTDFEAKRRERVARVRQRGAFNRFAYHARGPVAFGRDLVLSLRTPESLAADFDWLYGHRVPD